MKVYTDGGSRGNPGLGAYAFCIINDNDVITYEESKSFKLTTNNRMELMAVIRALEYINIDYMKKHYDDKEVIIHSDSQLVVNTINSGWRRNKNIDLWKIFDETMNITKNNGFRTTFIKVKGHSNNVFNNHVDGLLNAEMDKGQAALADTEYEKSLNK